MRAATTTTYSALGDGWRCSNGRHWSGMWQPTRQRRASLRSPQRCHASWSCTYVRWRSWEGQPFAGGMRITVHAPIAPYLFPPYPDSLTVRCWHKIIKIARERRAGGERQRDGGGGVAGGCFIIVGGHHELQFARLHSVQLGSKPYCTESLIHTTL